MVMDGPTQDPNPAAPAPAGAAPEPGPPTEPATGGSVGSGDEGGGPAGVGPHVGGDASSDDRFTIFVAVVITVVSILIAVTAWRTTEAANRASDLDSLAIQELARRQQELEDLNGQVDLDLRLYTRYQSHVLAARKLQQAADAAVATNAPDAQRLALEAQGDRALARVLRPFFRGAIPNVDAEGIASYDPEFVLRNLIAGSTRMSDLRPEETLRQSGVAHAQTSAFVLLVIVLAGCLLLLTLAQVVHGRLRRVFAFAGTVGALASLGLLVAVELVIFQGVA